MSFQQDPAHRTSSGALDQAPPRAPQSDLHAFGRTLWRWKYLSIAVGLIMPLLAISNRQPPSKYFAASTLVQVRNSSLDSTGNFLPDQGPIDANVASALVTSEEVLNVASRVAKIPNVTANTLATQIDVEVNTTTSFITIRARDVVSGVRAATIANAAYEGLRRYRISVARASMRKTLAVLTAQKKVAPTSQKETFADQIAVLEQRLRAADDRTVQLKPARPSSQVLVVGRGRSLPLAIVMGILIGIGAALFAEQLDRRVRTADELERVSGVRLLAVVPTSAFGGGPDKTGYVTQAIELLRASLWAFNMDKPLRRVIMISPRQGDGKTTVSVALAKAIARAGRTVTIVDADLRHPQISSRLEIEPGPGLTGILTGTATLQDALLAVDVRGGVGGLLMVLPAGPVAEHPAELIGSSMMRATMDELQRRSEIILIDTPAAMATSDALPLLADSDGVIVVARLRRTRYAALKRLLRRVEDAQGSVLGVVATGAKGASGYERYSYRAYGERHWYNRFRFWDRT